MFCLPVCKCVMCMAGAWWGQRKVSGPLELDLRMVARNRTPVLSKSTMFVKAEQLLSPKHTESPMRTKLSDEHLELTKNCKCFHHTRCWHTLLSDAMSHSPLVLWSFVTVYHNYTFLKAHRVCYLDMFIFVISGHKQGMLNNLKRPSEGAARLGSLCDTLAAYL